MRHLLAFLLLAAFACGAVPTNGLVARWQASSGVTTNASGYVSQWVDVVNGHVASQSTENLKPQLWTVQGRPALLWHHDPAVNTISNALTVAGTLTNHTRKLAVFAVSHGQVRVGGSAAWLTLSGYGAPILQAVQHPTYLRKLMQAGANSSGTIKAWNNVGVQWMTGNSSGSRVGVNYESEAQSTLAAVATSGGQIGGYGSTKPFQGAIFDLLIYDTDMSQATAESVVTALVEEYGIVTNHTAVVVARGDSMTEMVGQTNLLSWPTILADQYPQWRWVNAGWGGKKIGTNGVSGTMYEEDFNLVDPYYDASKPSWVLMQGGINGISSDGLSGDVAYSQLTNWSRARKETGWKVGLTTIPNKNNLTTIISNYNALIRAGNPARYDFVSDSGSDARLLDSTADAYFQADDFHLNTAGAQIVADWMRTNLQTYIGRTRFVATTGSDSNSGTETSPFLTVQKAVDVSGPGDTVVVAAGSYPEQVTTKSNATSTARISIIGAGRDTTTLRAFNVQHPFHTVRGFTFSGVSNTLAACVYIARSAHSTIVETNLFPKVSQASVYGVDFENGSGGVYGVNPSNCVLRGNSYLNVDYHSIDVQGQGHLISGERFESPYGWDALRISGNNHVFEWLTWTNWSNLTTNGNHPDIFQTFAVLVGTNYVGVSTNIVIQNSIAINCVGTQIGNVEDQGELGLVANWMIRNCLWINSLAAINIAAPGFRWYNNLFYRVGLNTGGPLVFRELTIGGEGHNGDVRNNIFFECGSNPADPSLGWVGWNPGVTNSLVQDYNLVIGTGAGTVKGSGWTLNGWNSHSLNGLDPLFVDAANLDFRPRTNSPLIGAGIDLSSTGFSDDFTGAIRTGTWTIGPIQVAGSGGGSGGGPAASDSGRRRESSGLIHRRR